jgi:hypothetical protein
MATAKLAPETVHLLQKREWSIEGEDSMLMMSSQAASLVMSEFVEVMSSATRPPVTSDLDGFRAQCNTLLCELRSPSGLQDKPVPTSAPTLGEEGEQRLNEGAELAFVLARIPRLAYPDRRVSARSLKRLLKVRSDAGFDEMRANYCAQVDAYVEDLRRVKTAGEQRVVHETWEQRLRGERTALKRELRSANLEAVVEKEGIIALALGVVGGGAALAATGPVGIAIGLALASAGIGRRALSRRRELMRGRWSSWLFVTDRGRWLSLT